MANRFSGLNAHKRIEETKAETTIEPEEQTPEIAPETTTGKVGRPKGKRSNYEYQQITAYVRKDTILEIKNILIQMEQTYLEYPDFRFEKKDFSEIIDTALSDWHNKMFYINHNFREDKRKEQNQIQRERRKAEKAAKKQK